MTNLPYEVQMMMKYNATTTVEDAIAMHRQGHVTIVDNGVSWSVHRLGVHLGSSLGRAIKEPRGMCLCTPQ